MNPINTDLVVKLIQEQFPEWSDFVIKPVQHSGHDNRTFHLGDHWSVRLPSEASYVPQVEKEQKWLPFLSKELSWPISTPIAQGKPSDMYPWPWSIYRWIEGETLSHERIQDLNQLASDLGDFLVELQSIDSCGGPIAGEHNFYRGGSLAVYDDEARSAIEHHPDTLDGPVLHEIWERALASTWHAEPVWVHGDIAPGNLLVQDERLHAVIDFGILGVGDPACDAAMSWTFFDVDSRKVFKQALRMDEDTWDRARGWALWKALITYDANRTANPAIAEESYRVIQGIVAEMKRGEQNMIELRPFEDSDIETIVTLFYETVHTINARDYTPEQLEAWASSEDQETRKTAWASSLRQNITYVAVMDNRIVGFADMTLEGELDRLYVHKDAQGLGVATALVNRLEAEAARLQLSAVETDASVTAKPFFARRGYAVIASQVVERKGVQLVNFKMRKSLGRTDNI